METQPNGKTALITGAASGIGQELARLFAKDGYSLVLVDQNEEGMQHLANHFRNQYGTQLTIISKDLANPQAPEEIYAQTSSQNLTIDVLVNDAGFGTYGMFATETDLQKELAIVQVNATALMHLTKLYVKDMVSRNEGKILMLGSVASVTPTPLQAVYGATKAFIKSFSEAIRNELKDTNITVTVLMPGATSTNFFKVAGAENAKGADPQKTASPADVARTGYEAMLAGEDHVVAGWMNKLRIAVAHVLPDPLVAASGRSEMAPKDSPEQQKQKQTMALVIGVAVLAGIWLVTRNRNTDVVAYAKSLPKRAKYKYKVAKAKHSAESSLDSVVDSIKGSYKQAKSNVEDAFA